MDRYECTVKLVKISVWSDTWILDVYKRWSVVMVFAVAGNGNRRQCTYNCDLMKCQ